MRFVLPTREFARSFPLYVPPFWWWHAAQSTTSRISSIAATTTLSCSNPLGCIACASLVCLSVRFPCRGSVTAEIYERDNAPTNWQAVERHRHQYSNTVNTCCALDTVKGTTSMLRNARPLTLSCIV